uniref:Uncharacterized protein n=2 Tax=Paulinella micropora TaxID=1928728 RepID=A0A1L5YB41_9EUKA|nr:hypothetical protein PCKR_119 [Paulinella micropora]AQX44687.1 hypothetical protein PFK_119 [Paulinella micropora]
MDLVLNPLGVGFNRMFSGPKQTKKLTMREERMDISVQASHDKNPKAINDTIQQETLANALSIPDTENFKENGNSSYRNNRGLNPTTENADSIENSNVIVSCDHMHQEGQSLILRSLVGALFPSTLYLIVDKNMELQPKPLKEFSKFKHLSEDDGDRQVLVVFGDPRQAKRLCGRTQRVIKLPDPSLLGRTASYLLVRGITRILLDGTLYSLD